MGFTGEDAVTLWVLESGSRSWMEATHPPRVAILEELRAARLLAFECEDMEDGSLDALSADPERVLKAEERGETSYFERMQYDHSDDCERGLLDCGRTSRPGRVPRRAGTAMGPSWTKHLRAPWLALRAHADG